MFIRKLDKIGRIVLPPGTLELADINKPENLYLSTEGDEIVIRKSKFRCAFCGANENLHNFKKHYICVSCMHEISKLQIENPNPYKSKYLILFPPF